MHKVEDHRKLIEIVVGVGFQIELKEGADQTDPQIAIQTDGVLQEGRDEDKEEFFREDDDVPEPAAQGDAEEEEGTGGFEIVFVAPIAEEAHGQVNAQGAAKSNTGRECDDEALDGGELGGIAVHASVDSHDAEKSVSFF